MKKMLFVGEKNVLVNSLIRICEENSGEVTQIDNSIESIQTLFQKKYDLIVTSVFLDGIDGIQLISALKHSNTFNSNTPIVLLTSGDNVDKIFKSSDLPNYIIDKNEAVLEEFQKAYLKLMDIKVYDRKVLYIDDDKFVRKVVDVWLSKVPGINLTLCSSLKELKELQDHSFDIVLTDHLLEDGTSKDVMTFFASLERKNIPIVVYTATVEKVDQKELESLGNILGIRPKPFQLNEFLSLLDSL